MMPPLGGASLPAGQWAKKIKGRKRPIITHTIGLLVGFVIQGAYVQDQDGAKWMLQSIRHTHPWLRHVLADGEYAGPKLRGTLAKVGCWTMEIVKQIDTQKASKSSQENG